MNSMYFIDYVLSEKHNKNILIMHLFIWLSCVATQLKGYDTIWTQPTTANLLFPFVALYSATTRNVLIATNSGIGAESESSEKGRTRNVFKVHVLWPVSGFNPLPKHTSFDRSLTDKRFVTWRAAAIECK